MQAFRDALIQEAKRRLFEESFPRVRQCLAELTEEQIWDRPNTNSNSVGNLVLHLEGNVRQWIISGLGKQADTRKRQSEFDERGPLPTSSLLKHLDQLEIETTKVLDEVTSEDLLQVHSVQGFQESGLSIITHVIEHFSYHVGQISYVVKAQNDIDLKYYEGQELDQTT